MIPTIVLFLQAASEPVFQSELWPGEGRPVFQAVTGTVALRQTASLQADIVAHLALSPGTVLVFDSTSYQTHSPGQLRSMADVVLRARDFGAVTSVSRERYYGAVGPQELHLSVGSMVEYLQYRAEGNCFMRVEARVFEVEDCPIDDDRFEKLAEPAVQWWIRITAETGITGWAHVNRDVVREVDREF